MSEHSTPTEERPAPPPAREPYSPPRLVRHGTVDDLTQGSVVLSVMTDGLSGQL